MTKTQPPTIETDPRHGQPLPCPACGADALRLKDHRREADSVVVGFVCIVCFGACALTLSPGPLAGVRVLWPEEAAT